MHQKTYKATVTQNATVEPSHRRMPKGIMTSTCRTVTSHAGQQRALHGVSRMKLHPHLDRRHQVQVFGAAGDCCNASGKGDKGACAGRINVECVLCVCAPAQLCLEWQATQRRASNASARSYRTKLIQQL